LANLKASNRLSHETWALADAYSGRNEFLGSTVSRKIQNEDQWLTRYILPWRKTDNLNLQWVKWDYDPTLADVLPPQRLRAL